MMTGMSLNPSTQGENLSVGFVLLHRFTLLPFAAFIDCLRLAADEGDRSRQLRCHWNFMSSDGEAALSSCGATISPCEPFHNPKEFDYIVIIGGVQDERDGVDTTALAYMRQAGEAGVPLVGLCTGVFAMIQAGLMSGRRCCVSWYHHRDMVQRFPAIQPVADQLFIDDGDRLTCAGGVASADLAAYLIERHLGKAWAMKSLHIMLLDEARAGTYPQPQPVVFGKIEDRLVRRAITLLEQHLGEAISMDLLAERVGTSRRNLERRFRETLGVGPQKFARDLRLRYGAWLLHYTGKSITEIGERCGFADTAHFSRHFRSTFSMTPSEMRKRASVPDSDQVDPFFLHIDGLSTI
ncbi:GlxA family transcriptional regulator [Halomonas sp. KO116]|uniref:GlxA family transcriptional regulator n=1 Tax=Halomonas sp. KO116 TaxID=1504981 RepID=UPI0004E3F9BE|nr:GlxA family transcriptional regulator [Halomonas sp. KO116]AJY48945.1 transcriptional regulator with aminotransferase type sensor, AraC family [Halomonas sp. KO116]